MKAKDIMNKNVITVRNNASIEEIAKIMSENHVSGVPVVNEENDLVGIVTEGDLLHKETAPRTPGVLSILGAFIYFNGVDRYKEDFSKLAATKAEQIMTSDVVTITEDMDIHDIAAVFVEKNINRVPVMRNKKIMGIVSRADIIKTLACK